MTFEDILALCLDALEHGETIERCLSRYPQHAAELSSLLSVATAVRSAPQPRLSAGAFARGYATVVTQIHYQRAPFRPEHRTVLPKSATPTPHSQSIATPKFIAKPPPLARSLLFVHKAQTALLACLVALSLFALFRNINISLPGAWLYPVKLLGENMGGVLLTAAGEQATWHAQQTENRLQELTHLTQQDKIASIELERTIDQEVVATLAASNQLPSAQRTKFLQEWLTHLQAIDKANQGSSTATLTRNRMLATIQAATQVTVAQPTPAPVTTPTSAPTPQLADSRIILPTATANPTADTSLVTGQTTPSTGEESAQPLDPVVIHPAIVAPALAPTGPMVLATSTTIPVMVQVPQTMPLEDNNSHQAPSKAAVSQPTSTTAAIVAAASTETLGINNVSSSEVQPSTSPTTSVETAPDNAATNDNTGRASTPTETSTPSFGVVDNPTPATDNGSAIAPTMALVTEEATAATPPQTASPPMGTPSTDKVSLPTRNATVIATIMAMPSGTASNLATPPTAEPEKTAQLTATDNPTDRPEPTASAKPTKTPEPADTADQRTPTLETAPTATPTSTPTPKKHK